MSSKEELLAKALTLGITVDGRWGCERLEQEIDEVSNRKHEAEPERTEDDSEVAEGQEQGSGQEVQEGESGGDDEISGRVAYMNSRVLAVWEGQSSSLPIHERKRRIIKAMEDKGFGDILEAIEWP